RIYRTTWEHRWLHPSKDPVLGDLWRRNPTLQRRQRRPHFRSWPLVAPPLSLGGLLTSLGGFCDSLLEVTIGHFVQHSVLLGSPYSEINQPCVAWPTHDIHAIDPSPQNVAIRLRMWVWQVQPFARSRPIDLEGSAKFQP